MKSKIISGFLMAAFTVLLAASFASAVTIASSNDFSLSQSTSTITVTNTENVNHNLTFNSIAPIIIGANTVTFTVTPSPSLNFTNQTSPQVLTATVTSTLSGDISTIPFGEYTTTLTGTSNDTSVIVPSTTLTFNRDFCSAGEQGASLGLEIDRIKIKNDGDDDETWIPLDTVTVEVKVENNGQDNIDDVFVELALFDKNGKNVINDMDFTDSDEEEIDLGTIKDGKDDTATFEFQVPADFEDGSYKLAVKAYSDDLGEQALCLSSSNDLSDTFFQDIDVDRDSDNPIVVDDIQLSIDTATAGDKVTATFKVWNVGTSDEDQVRVNVRNDVLGVNINEEIKQGIDEGEGEQLELSFTVPSGVDDGLYSLVYTVDFDYDSKSDVYDDSSKDSWSAFLKVAGAAEPEALQVDITADLKSDAVAGKQMIVSSTISNNDDESKTYVIDAKNFEDWATLDSISDRLLTLTPGESADVEFTFDVDKGVSGEESFIIEVLSGEQLEQREVAVNVQDNSLLSRLGGTGDNNLIWIIGIINVVLIILIIIVAVRLSSR